MKMQEYIRSYDGLALEDALYEIPVRREYLLSQIGQDMRILDVGCLGGRLSQLLMRKRNEVHGIELNKKAADIASARGIRVRVADVEDGIPFESGFFDIIHAGDVLETLYDTRDFFLECRRTLKPGGTLLFTTPNLNSLDNRVRILLGEFPEGIMGAYPEDHAGQNVRAFNVGKVRELCRETGFRIEEIRGIPSLRPRGPLLDGPLALAGRFFPNLSRLLLVKATRLTTSAECKSLQ